MPYLHGTPGERIADLREQRGLKKKNLQRRLVLMHQQSEEWKTMK